MGSLSPLRLREGVVGVCKKEAICLSTQGTKEGSNSFYTPGHSGISESCTCCADCFCLRRSSPYCFLVNPFTHIYGCLQGKSQIKKALGNASMTPLCMSAAAETDHKNSIGMPGKATCNYRLSFLHILLTKYICLKVELQALSNSHGWFLSWISPLL